MQTMFCTISKKKYQQIKVTFNHLPILYDWCERVSFHVDILLEAVGIKLSLCIIILLQDLLVWVSYVIWLTRPR